MAAPTTPTKLQFPRFDPPGTTRSPSRSPRRRAFAIRQLDPLLSNLSPDSTLKALQATETIPGGAAQDVLTNSIADATPAEREIGIRAAFAGQKLREWKNEVSRWNWPGKRERQLGLGFIAPAGVQEADNEHLGSLPANLVDHYEERVEDIREDLDKLGMDDIKDHVLEAHGPIKSMPKAVKPTGAHNTYGRMRDFTALVTATVIQALPDLAILNMLLDSWDTRLRVLRQLPGFHLAMTASRRDLADAFNAIRNPDQRNLLTETTVAETKAILDAKVAESGRRVDRMLDLLEDQEDSLPQVWIDQLEKVELDYATWVVEAQHVAMNNALASQSLKKPAQEPAILEPEVAPDPAPSMEQADPSPAVDDAKEDVPMPDSASVEVQEVQEQRQPQTSDLQPPPTVEIVPGITLPAIPPTPAMEQELQQKPKPSLTIDLSVSKSHRRGASKASIAESHLSGFSDISNAEIVEATSTTVLPSPKIQMVETESTFRQTREELTWFSKGSAHVTDDFRPPMLQRASTASIEIVPKDQLKKVTLRRTSSWDMVANMPQSPDSTPSKALQQLVGGELPVKMPTTEVEDPPVQLQLLDESAAARNMPFPSLDVESAQPPPSNNASDLSPALPRRSSKRNTIASDTALTPISTLSSPREPATPVSPVEKPSPKRPAESLDDKIQDILTTLPTKIRLAKDADTSSSNGNSSEPSTRSGTPTPHLTLSPVKPDSSSRRSSANDPEVRVYHLTRSGAARDTPPVKLFVRTVGDGNRVMVRVGGGWADLAEYLREYSLHHGSRTGTEGRLEVASFPTNRHRYSTGNILNGTESRRKSKSPTLPQGGFESTPPDLNPPKTRKTTSDAAWTPPPVPQIPSSYAAELPVVTATATATAKQHTALSVSITKTNSPETPTTNRSHVAHTPNTTTTTVITPQSTSTTTSHTSYTPLGAAGPKIAKRAATYSTVPRQDEWVNTMVGKARAVSGVAPTVNTETNQQGHSVTTTTTVSSGPTRRRSSYFGLGSSPRSVSSLGTSSPAASPNSETEKTKKERRASITNGSGRPKSRMSLGDIGGIKRVFLRKRGDGK